MTELTPLSIEQKLAPFLATNPEAKIGPSDDHPIIRNAWGDESFVLRVKEGSDDLIRSLNNLRLPPRFSAIWHLDTNDMEFIFAPLSKNDPILSRTFIFRFDNHDYKCEFAEASKDIELIAAASRIVNPPTDTNHRNLGNIEPFVRYRKHQKEKGLNEDIVIASFYIRQLNCDEELLVNVTRHLNYYTRYFDRRTPIIIIHETPIISAATEQPIQFPFGDFPKTISGKSIDPYLLSLWESSVNTSDTFRKFLYSFQIIEYAAFYYLREDLSRNIKRVLNSPDLPCKLDSATKQILDIMVDEKTTDEAKFNIVVQNNIDHEIVWNELQSKLPFFTNATEFEGGCNIPALIQSNWTCEIFEKSWLPKLPDSLRKIRNGLVHSRELRQAKCILPTNKNNHLLRPWTALMSVMANQIIIHGNS